MAELSAPYFLTREWGTSIVHVILLHTSGLPVFKKVCSTNYEVRLQFACLNEVNVQVKSRPFLLFVSPLL